LTTTALKVAANTDSPNGEGPAWPSGHTSSSFTVAEVLNQSYGPWVGVPAYALAGVAAFGRIDDEEHDFRDLIFGMALGIVVGHTVATEHELEIFGGEITPYVDPYTGGGGLAWVKYW
jgi:membrane-associated phospholipid phosphatase